jgi:hypothetical protein
MTSDLDSLVQRVERLERQNLQLKALGPGIALGMAVFLLAGAAGPPRTVEAEKIVIRDRHGRARITLGTPAFAGSAIDTNPDDPMIWLSDDKGADRAMLGAEGLYFANGKAKPTVSITSAPGGPSSVKLFETDGRVSWSAP